MAKNKNNNTKIFIFIISVLVAVFIITKITKKIEYNGNFVALVPQDEIMIKGQIKNFDLFVDFSGSMRGYIDFAGVDSANNTLISTVANFLDNVESEYDVETKCHCDTNTYSKDGFRAAMQNRTIFNGGCTLLHEMIKECSSNANNSSVVAIVTDMVLSYGKPKLISQGDNYYNLHHLDGLASEIHGAMTGIKKNNLDVVLLQYYSDYNGNYYYNYTENIVDGNSFKGILMEERPFYVMLVGSKNNLRSILANECIRIPEQIYTSFSIEEDGLKESAFSIDEIQTGYWVKGNADKATKAGFMAGTKLGDKTTQFEVSCNSFKVPSYINTNNLVGHCSVGTLSNISYNDNRGSISFVYESIPYGKSNRETNITIEILGSRMRWADNASVSDDTSISKEDMRKRTWGFKTIYNAIDEAFNGRKGLQVPVIGKFSFSLAKK